MWRRLQCAASVAGRLAGAVALTALAVGAILAAVGPAEAGPSFGFAAALAAPAVGFALLGAGLAAACGRPRGWPVAVVLVGHLSRPWP